jgi:methyl-accepting chemotaxis protein
MSEQRLEPLKRRRLSLSVGVSMGFVIAAILPLLITLLFSEWQARPALTAQANTSMKSDAKTRVQLIDTYFNERLLDAQTLTQVPSVQTFLATNAPPTSPQYKDLAVHALYSLVAGKFRDKRYTTWMLFAPQGQPVLYYPLNNPPKPHGKSFVAPQYLQSVRAGKTFITDVYYTPQTGKPSVDIYSPIITQPGQGSTLPPHKYLGFIRATLNLDYIWNIVDGDLGNNGTGSYAFILDQNGVRIADTDPARRFKAVEKVSDSAQQQISSELRYGTTDDVPVLKDTAMAAELKNPANEVTFQVTPTGQNEQFQAVLLSASTMPWKYVVLSPVRTVTAVADQQLWFTALIAVTASALVAIIGLIVGRNITRPITVAVSYMRDSSHALTMLATRQQDAASEQTWVVDSTQVGLQSVKYYTDAISIAAHQLNELGLMLARDWNYMDAQRARQALEKIVTASSYIENATDFQNASNEKLATAIKVASQVTEQLFAGATSATDAATQLESIVAQLRNVVGK